MQNSGKIKTTKVKQDIDLFGKSRTLMPGRKTVVLFFGTLEAFSNTCDSKGQEGQGHGPILKLSCLRKDKQT